MEEEKRKVEDFEDDDDGLPTWKIIAQWLFVLLIIVAVILYTLIIMGPIIGNVFSAAIDCACLR